jgi:hypothetical protein
MAHFSAPLKLVFEQEDNKVDKALVMFIDWMQYL